MHSPDVSREVAAAPELLAAQVAAESLAAVELADVHRQVVLHPEGLEAELTRVLLAPGVVVNGDVVPEVPQRVKLFVAGVAAQGVLDVESSDVRVDVVLDLELLAADEALKLSGVVGVMNLVVVQQMPFLSERLETLVAVKAGRSHANRFRLL